MNANFPLATSEVFTNREGQRVEQTEWHNVVVWGKQAGIAEKYLQKGKLIYLEGRLRTRSWDDQQGNKRYITEVITTNFTMLGRKDEGGEPSQQEYGQPAPQRNEASQQPPAGSQPDVSSDDNPEDDLPF